MFGASLSWPAAARPAVTWLAAVEPIMPTPTAPGTAVRAYRPRLAMYWTTPSGTRYQTGSPAATRFRHSLLDIASAGISTRETFPSGSPAPVSRCPGLCLLYTSDAADDLLCVDLGGRRIIKKKKKYTHR